MRSSRDEKGGEGRGGGILGSWLFLALIKRIWIDRWGVVLGREVECQQIQRKTDRRGHSGIIVELEKVPNSNQLWSSKYNIYNTCHAATCHTYL